MLFLISSNCKESRLFAPQKHNGRQVDVITRDVEEGLMLLDDEPDDEGYRGVDASEVESWDEIEDEYVAGEDDDDESKYGEDEDGGAATSDAEEEGRGDNGEYEEDDDVAEE